MDWLLNSNTSKNGHLDAAIGFKMQLIQKPRLLRREWMISLGLAPNEAGDYFKNFQFAPSFKVDFQKISSFRVYPYINVPFNYTWGKDDLGLKASKIIINPQIGLEFNHPKRGGQDYLIQIGYYLAHLDSDWIAKNCDQNDNCERDEADWNDSMNANIDKKTLFISIGIKNWNIDNKFW